MNSSSSPPQAILNTWIKSSDSPAYVNSLVCALVVPTKYASNCAKKVGYNTNAQMTEMVTAGFLLFLFLGGTLSTTVGNQPCHGDWLKLGKPDGDYHIRVILAIKQTNPGWLESKLRAVSYTNSPEYGNYQGRS